MRRIESVSEIGRHLSLIHKKIVRYGGDPEKHPDTVGFQIIKYASTDFNFHAGIGKAEANHIDTDAYQAILILDPNGWMITSEDSFPLVQNSGDLIILDQSKLHGVRWSRSFPAPKKPWVHLFIDIYNRSLWSKKIISEDQAAEYALSAIQSLNDPVHLHWLFSNS